MVIKPILIFDERNLRALEDYNQDELIYQSMTEALK